MTAQILQALLTSNAREEYVYIEKKEVNIMRVCKNCGTKFDDSVRFCPMCGTNIRTNQLPGSAKQPITVGGWIGRSLISFIPVVGSLIYFIMLFIWSGNKEKEDTFRNWAKAQLIIIAAVIVLAFAFGLLFGTSLSELLESIS